MNPCESEKAIERQVGGSHYGAYEIQPIEFIHKNRIPFIEGCIIKYVLRWRRKNGVEDLLKAKHYIDLLLEMEDWSDYEEATRRG